MAFESLCVVLGLLQMNFDKIQLKNESSTNQKQHIMSQDATIKMARLYKDVFSYFHLFM